MKKILIFIVGILISTAGFSQIFSEGFEGAKVYSLISEDWTYLDEDGSGETFFYNGVLFDDFISYAEKDGGGNWGTEDNWIIFEQTSIPNISGNYLLKFDVRNGYGWNGSTINCPMHYEVLVSTTTNAPGEFTMIYEQTLPGKFQLQEKSINLNAYKGDDIYVAIRHCNSTTLVNTGGHDDYSWIRVYTPVILNPDGNIIAACGNHNNIKLNDFILRSYGETGEGFNYKYPRISTSIYSLSGDYDLYSGLSKDDSDAEEWIISETISVPSDGNEYMFSCGRRYPKILNQFNNNVELRISITGTDIVDFTDLVTMNRIVPKNGSYGYYITSLDAYAGEDIHFALRTRAADATQTSSYDVDDIIIDKLNDIPEVRHTVFRDASQSIFLRDKDAMINVYAESALGTDKVELIYTIDGGSEITVEMLEETDGEPNHYFAYIPDQAAGITGTYKIKYTTIDPIYVKQTAVNNIEWTEYGNDGYLINDDFESYDAYNQLPFCWNTKKNYTSSGGGWSLSSDFIINHTSNQDGNAIVSMQLPEAGDESYLITNKMYIADYGHTKFTFWRMQQHHEGPKVIEVCVSTTGTELDDFSVIYTTEEKYQNLWWLEEVDLSDFKDQYIYIALRSKYNPNMSAWAAIDDVQLVGPEDNQGPEIKFTSSDVWLPNENALITAEITDRGGVQSTRLYYTIEGNEQSIDMTWVNGYNYSAVIPAQEYGTIANVYILATDNGRNHTQSSSDTIDVLWTNATWWEWGLDYNYGYFMLRGTMASQPDGYAAVDFDLETNQYYPRAIEIAAFNDKPLDWYICEMGTHTSRPGYSIRPHEDNIIGNLEGTITPNASVTDDSYYAGIKNVPTRWYITEETILEDHIAVGVKSKGSDNRNGILTDGNADGFPNFVHTWYLQEDASKSWYNWGNGSDGTPFTIPAYQSTWHIRALLEEIALIPDLLDWSVIKFDENIADDGSISTIINITLESDAETFSQSSGLFTEGIHYNSANVPNGLTLQITVTSSTTAEIELTGNATEHTILDNIDNLEISFTDAAFTGGDADNVVKTSRNNISLIYIGEPANPTVAWEHALFIEALSNDGSIQNTLGLELYNETFSIVGDLVENTDFTTANVPEGLSVQITVIDSRNASILLINNAISHENENDVSNLEITFLDNAFTGGNASNVTNYSITNIAIDFDDAPLYAWTGSESSDWHTFANWNPTDIPRGSDNVYIPNGCPNYPVIDDEYITALCYNLHIEDNASLTIATNGQMTIENKITNEAGTSGIIIESNEEANGSLIIFDIDAQATVNRFIPKTNAETGQWHYLGSQIVNSNTSPFGSEFYQYNEDADDYWNGAEYLYNTTSGWQNPTGNLQVTTGYSYYCPEETITYQGQLNYSENYVINLDYTEHTGNAPNDNPYNLYDGWNLIANPYTCALNWEEIQKTNTNKTAYFYDDIIDNFTYYTNDGIAVNNASKYILPGQGIFVKTNQTDGTITIPDNSRIHHKLNYNQNNNKENEDIKGNNENFIRLVNSENGYQDETVIRFIEGANLNFDDNFDAYKRFSLNEQVPQLYSIMTENYTEFAINTLPITQSEILIPIGFTTNNSGEHTITITEFNVWGGDFTFEDTELNVVETITEGYSYTFNLDAGNSNDRFFIRILFNPAPIVENPIEDQQTYENDLYSFTFDENVFSDDGVLTYTASLSDNTQLPDWLNFSSNTRTFEGTPLDQDVGSIDIKVTATDEYSGTAYSVFNLEVIDVNSINRIENNEFLIYPNPANEFVNIVKAENFVTDKEINIYIYDILGKCVTKSTIQTNQLTKKIDVSNLEPGTYILEIQTKNQIINYKINIL